MGLIIHYTPPPTPTLPPPGEDLRVGRSSRVARVLTITLQEDITKPLLLVNTFLKDNLLYGQNSRMQIMNFMYLFLLNIVD